jgi:hypothetical protein
MGLFDDYEEGECWNCHGEGFVYGCSWDWQCDTYDEGEGTCLCTRRCSVCNPAPPNPELVKVLGDALAASVDTHAKRGDATEIAAPSPMSGAVPAKQGDAQTPKDSGQ